MKVSELLRFCEVGIDIEFLAFGQGSDDYIYRCDVNLDDVLSTDVFRFYNISVIDGSSITVSLSELCNSNVISIYPMLNNRLRVYFWF